MRMFFRVLALFVVTCMHASAGDTLDLASCQRLARANYPLSGRQDLIVRSRELSVTNLSRGYWPQLSLSGQATYQSDVTGLPGTGPLLSKDQYKVYGEVSQVLYDGGAVGSRKGEARASAEAAGRQLDVDLYRLVERVDDLYFGLLLLDEQRRQAGILKADIDTGLNRVRALIANGAALNSEGDILEAERLKADQRIIEIESSERAFRTMLGLFIGRPVEPGTVLLRPLPPPESPGIQRPELALFAAQKNVLEAQDRVSGSATRPTLGLFFQGGYGRPALNFLDDAFDSYYIGGIRLNWPIAGYYTRKREKALFGVRREEIDAMRDAFLFDTNIRLQQQDEDVQKLRQLLHTDDEIVGLRGRVKRNAMTRLENGVITANDYLREVHAEDLARQDRAVHEIQLLMIRHARATAAGNRPEYGNR